MAHKSSKFHQALIDLIEAYSQIEDVATEKHGDDESAANSAILEVLETSIESAIEEQDASTSFLASMLSSLSEALEQIDPSAFEESDEDYDEYEAEDSDIDLDEDDDDLDEMDDDDDDD